MSSHIPLVIDDRERAGPLPAVLAQAGVFDMEIRRLAVGDYLVDGRLLFERKTLPDLALSIKDGRLFGQALRLAASPLHAGRQRRAGPAMPYRLRRWSSPDIPPASAPRRPHASESGGRCR